MFLKYQPSKRKELNEFRHKIRHLRKIGRNKIIERINAYKNNEPIPDDILSTILAGYSNKRLFNINLIKQIRNLLIILKRMAR